MTESINKWFHERAVVLDSQPRLIRPPLISQFCWVRQYPLDTPQMEAAILAK